MRNPTSENDVGQALRERFAQNVRCMRKSRGLTQAKTAAVAGVHRSSIIRIEMNQFSVTLETIAALARALGTTPERLLADSAD